MNPSRDQIIAVVYASIDELNAMVGRGQMLAKSPNTVILKDGLGLDSLAFVNLVSLIEQKCEESFGKSLVLSETGKNAGTKQPLETIATLVEYIEGILRA